MIRFNLLFLVLPFSYLYSDYDESSSWMRWDSTSSSQSGYLRSIDVSFCMDECSQFYLESEVDGEGGSLGVVSFMSGIDLSLYFDRYVQVG